jgi:hypothetical protein
MSTASEQQHVCELIVDVTGQLTALLPPHLQAYERSVAVQVISSLRLNLWHEMKPPTAKLCSE